MRWISDCDCGRKDKRFKLLGRTDNVIQVWSCRLLMTDIENCLSSFNILSYQIQVLEEVIENSVKEKVLIHFEETHKKINPELLALKLYEASRDVKDTIDFVTFKAQSEFIGVTEIPRNPRTGKISVFIDSRK